MKTEARASSPNFTSGVLPERFVEVDAARLLLILDRFAQPVAAHLQGQAWYPRHEVARHFTPEYYLHKLDFLLRYPGYVAYEFTELYRMGFDVAQDRAEVMRTVRSLLRNREPERMTVPFRKFWRGAYERLDDVEAWWQSRMLVFTAFEPRGATRPQKHYFLAPGASDVVQRLVDSVSHARWYAERIALIHQYFGSFGAADVRSMQYKHMPYRDAQLNETIPDLAPNAIAQHFADVFGEALGVPLEE